MPPKKDQQQQSSNSTSDKQVQYGKFVKTRKSKFATWKKEFEELKAVVDRADTEVDELEAQLEVSRTRYAVLHGVHQQVLDILEDLEDENTYLTEENWGADIQKQMIQLEIKAKKKLTLLNQTSQGTTTRQTAGSTGRVLPRLELPKFGGDVREWLPYWSQFEEIDKDKSISNSDKFQYLVQSMVDGSEAKEVVMSYPITALNYPLAVDQLKKRYGRERMLVKVYVRDLIRLVIDNATHGKIPLSTLYVKLSAQLRALGTLGVTTDKCAAVIYPLVESCLPEEVLRAWQRDPTYKEAQEKDGEEELKLLIAFLEREVGAEDNIKLACSGLTDDTKTTKEKSRSRKSPVPTANSLVSVAEGSKKITCLFCGNGHPATECGQGEKLTLTEKKSKLEQGRACYKCLKLGHTSKKCKVFVKCLVCGNKHPTIMCPELPHHRTSSSSEPVKEEKVDAGSTTSSMSNQEHSTGVIMQTLLVDVIGKKKSLKTRVLIDTGSQKSYVTKELAEEAGLRKVGEETVNHILFGGVQTKPTTHNRYKVVLSKVDGNFRCDFDVSDVPVISGTIPRIPKGPWIEELRNKKIILSDHGHDLKNVGILVGADVAAKLFTGERLVLGSGPVAVNTLLGWTVMGKTDPKKYAVSTKAEVVSMSNLDVEVSKLWELEVIGITDSSDSKSRKELEEAALHHFNQTVSRSSEGRYQVHLPWIEGHQPLPSNQTIAEKRLKTATEKMKKLELFGAYDNELKKWEAAGKIEKVPESEWTNYGHYLPHRAVVKVGSTTPVRPVFDASCKSKGQPSLNECLEKGPNMLEKIPAVLTKIRMDSVGVVADIEKAFQQIEIVPRDRDFMRFLWWTDETCTKMKIYRHCRVVFGVSSSPFLLAATLNHIADHSNEKLKNTAKSFVDCTYVDNLSTSVPDMKEYQRVKEECDELLLPAKFNLRGWEYGPRDEEKSIPLLGMLWDVKNDDFRLDLSAFTKKVEGPITKRSILSLVHMVFDPIGYSTPVTIVPKKMLQETWMLKLGWDTELPSEMCKDFVKWRTSIADLSSVRIPRMLNPICASKDKWELHMFADASQTAYAAVVYVRVPTEDGATVNIVQAKSRIKPLSKVTIPRMELMACLIGSRLLSSVKSMLGLPDARIVCWTDSSTAYYWIRNFTNWGVFVQRRVNEIRSLTFEWNWRHVAGELNPADLPSRGCTVAELKESKWWEGPKWLSLPEEEWQESSVNYKQEEINEEKKKSVVSSLATNDVMQKAICELKSYEEMVDFVHRNGCQVPTDEISNEQFRKAEHELMRLVQKWSFQGANSAKLKKFQVQVQDDDGLLRMKTRLLMGDFTENFKYPIFLPYDSPVTTALIRFEHVRNSHAGVSTLLASLREKFWILKGRRTIRAAIRTCDGCQRFTVKKMSPSTPALPKERVQATSPYQISGVDYFGPVILKNGSKCWVALFTCAVYRAVHLELVPSLTTEDFLNAFRRFVSRRGRPEIMYSDNGTNFLGCSNAFKAINWNKITKYGSFRRIEWRFNPPTASWWGGWFERLVGVVKQTLRKVLGNTSLNKEEFATVLCEAEAVVNQRPLTYISEDGDELIPLTPQLFLSGEKSTYLPEVNEVDQQVLNKSLKYLREIGEHLRTRFRKEYLGQLVHVKGKEEKRALKVGDVVLVGTDQKKRLDWPLGKIIEIIPGKDGKVRVVRVKTAVGELLRPVQRIFPLEVEEEAETKVTLGTEDEESSVEEKTADKRVEGVTRSGRKVTIPDRLTYVYI